MTSDADDPVPDITIFQNVDIGRIDVLVSKTEFEATAVARAMQLGRLRVATVEDLLAYKLIAGRTRDFLDIEEIVRTQERAGRTVDWDTVGLSIAPWDLDDRLERARRSSSQRS